MLSASTPLQPTHAVGNAYRWQTVNFDPGFRVSETETLSLDNYSYWHPSAHGNVNPQCSPLAESQANITLGALHTLQDDTGSTGWSCYDNAVAQAGNFPWQGVSKHCTAQKYHPDWTCPRNSYGIQRAAHTEFQDRASANLTFNIRNVPTSGIGRYNIFLDFYFWFSGGNQTSDQAHGCASARCTYAWMEAIVRLASAQWTATCACWTNTEPVGAEGVNDAGTNFGFHQTVAQLTPGLSYALANYNVTRLYRDAITMWNLDPNTHGVLIGIEVGTEGYGSALSVDFQDVRVETYMPDIAAADLNFDHTINILDIAFVAEYYGKCPHNTYQYAWIADVVSQEGSGDCVDTLDLAFVAFYYDQSY